MKTLIKILFFFLLVTQICNAQWVLTNAPANVPIYTFASNGSNVFAGGDITGLVATGGTVFHSTNNGLDWSIIGVTPDCPEIRSIEVDDEKIFAGSFGGGVFLSTNMGVSWGNINNGLTNTDVYTLLFTPSGLGGKNLYAGTMGGGVFISTNYGADWLSMSNGLPNLLIYSLNFIQTATNDIILIAGTGSGVYISTNNGLSWSQTAMNANYINSLTVSGENIFASTGHLFLSTDRGTSWTNVTTGLSNLPVWALATYGPNVFTLTNWGGIYLSTNNGSNWTLINEGIIDTLVLAIGITDNYIFASGVAEGLWRRPLSDLISAVGNLSFNPTKFSLDQNYPNPFNPTTKISWQSPVSSRQVLKVFDVLGNEVAMLVNEEMEAGYQSVDFDASELPSGVFFYQLRIYLVNGKAGNFIETKKMLLLR